MKIEPLSFSLEKLSVENSNPTTGDFKSFLGDALKNTNQKILKADDALEKLSYGEMPNLHQAMIILEEAKLSFQFLEQIRNRLMNAYQDILREQI